MTHEEEVRLGNQAAEVLNNEAYIAAFETIQREIIETWTKAPARDSEGRERLWLMQTMLTKVQDTLKATMDGGKMALLNLQYEQKKNEPTQSYIE